MAHPASDQIENRVLSRRRGGFCGGDAVFKARIRKYGPKSFCFFCRNPVAGSIADCTARALRGFELTEIRVPGSSHRSPVRQHESLREHDQGLENVRQFVRVAYIRPGLSAHLIDSLRIESACFA